MPVATGMHVEYTERHCTHRACQGIGGELQSISGYPKRPSMNLKSHKSCHPNTFLLKYELMIISGILHQGHGSVISMQHC